MYVSSEETLTANTAEQIELLNKLEKEDCKKTYVHMTEEKKDGDICKCP